MRVDYFDWDDEDDPTGNTRHVISAGYDPVEIEDAISAHEGPIGITRRTRRPMIRTTKADGEEVIIVFEIETADDLVIVRPITAFPQEN